MRALDSSLLGGTQRTFLAVAAQPPPRASSGRGPEGTPRPRRSAGGRAWTPLGPGTYRLGRRVMQAALRHLSDVPGAILDEAARAGRADDMTAVVVRG